MHFCAVHFLGHLRRNEVGITRSNLQDAVQIIDTEYCRCCKALRLRDATVHVGSSSSGGDLQGSSMLQPVQQVSQAADSDDCTSAEEDTSWFFDAMDDNTGNTLLTTDELLVIAQESSAYLLTDALSDEVMQGEVSVPPTVHPAELRNEMFSHEWLLAGLQHCIPHEYSVLRASLCDIALPMQLAGSVKQHLWTQPTPSSTQSSQRVDISDAADVADLLHEMSTTEGRLKASMAKHLHMRSITGLRVSRSCAMPGALVLGCNTRDYDRIRTIRTASNALSAGSSACEATKVQGVSKDMITFSRTVVVGANLGMLGETFHEQNSVLGNSQQARSIQTTKIVSADVYIHSLRANVLHEQSSYVQRMCTVLKYQKVQLLLCYAGMMTTNLVDCLAAHNIAVLPLQTEQELNSATEITGAEIVDDIAALQDCDVGYHSVCIQHILELPQVNVKYKPPNISHSESVDNEQEELCIGGLRINAEGILQVGGDGEHQCLVAVSRVPSAPETQSTTLSPGFRPHTMHDVHEVDSKTIGDGHWECDGGSGPVCVLICAPTAIMTQAITDRFYRCLHRLRAVAEAKDGGCAVLPGAGVLEIVCILRLDEVVRSLRAATTVNVASAIDGVKENSRGTEEVRGQVEIIRLFQQVLVEYLCTIMLNSGCSYAESFEQVNNTLCALRELVSSGINVDCCDTLAFLTTLSNEEKMALPQAIRLEGVPVGEHVLVLDAVRLKKASLQSALHVVCELAGLRFV